MHILLITPSYKPAYIYGGPTMSVSQLAQTLLLAKAVVTVYTTTANGKEELNVVRAKSENVDGVSVFYFSRWTKDHTHFSPALVWRVFRDCKKYDVVHIQSWWNLVSVLSVAMCWARGVRPVLSPRGMLSLYSFQHQKAGVKQFFHRTIGRFLLARTVLHATSEAERNECLLLLKNWDNFVLPNVVKLPEIKAGYAQHSRNNKFVIGFMSRIDRKKGIELLMKALADFSRPFQLRIAGNGDVAYVEELKQLGTTLDIAEKIEWIGWVDGDKKFAFLRELDLFALTSHNENFANVIVEALSVGTPVLVTEGVGLADFVLQNKVGWVSKHEVNSIYHSLILAFEDLQTRNQIRQEGGTLIYNNFTGLALIKKYVDKYSALKK